MDSETEQICPICHDSRDDIAFVLPCCHRFCLGCILRWTEIQAQCPLCRRLIEAVKFSVRSEYDYLQVNVTGLRTSL